MVKGTGVGGGYDEIGNGGRGNCGGHGEGTIGTFRVRH
jgi:hypothetical protein